MGPVARELADAQGADPGAGRATKPGAAQGAGLAGRAKKPGAAQGADPGAGRAKKPGAGQGADPGPDRARGLAGGRGVLEPLQTASTVAGQVSELAALIHQYSHPPVVLIGHSWGAMLSFMVTAVFPALVKKLVLVSSGVFEDSYAASIEATRLGRLSEGDMAVVMALSRSLEDGEASGRNGAFARLGRLISRADAFDPLPDQGDADVIECQYDLHRQVWGEAREMRRRGRLLALGRSIKCPVVAIHGDYDPHPAEGVRGPLAGVLADFRFVLLERCGHRPWVEKAARDRFYSLLREELA